MGRLEPSKMRVRARMGVRVKWNCKSESVKNWRKRSMGMCISTIAYVNKRENKCDNKSWSKIAGGGSCGRWE